MRRKLLTIVAFAFLLGAGTVAAAAVAGLGPSSAQQTVTTVTTGTTTAPTTTTTTVATTTTTPAKKIRICHHTQGKKGTKHVTITVSQSALKGHLKHGDSTTPCNTPKSKKFHSRPAHVKKFHKKAKKR